MTERPSPSRARRLWLEERLRRARRAVDVLDRKRQVLLQEDRRLRERRERAVTAWLEADLDARRWAARARAVAGAGMISFASWQVEGRAELSASRTRTVGVDHPGEVRLELPPVSPELLAAAGPAVQAAVASHRGALEAAADCAVAESAYRSVHAELQATERRQRAIERIRIPELESELWAVGLRLDELERQERMLSRWAAAGRDGQ